MITEFELQTGEGTNVEIIGGDNDEMWLIIDEAHMLKMIQMAFDVPEFTLEHLRYALRQADNYPCPKCKSTATRWLDKPPKGQIGSGPAHFHCVVCRSEWADNGREVWFYD